MSEVFDMTDNAEAALGTTAFLALAAVYFYAIAKAVVVTVESAAGLIF